MHEPFAEPTADAGPLRIREASERLRAATLEHERLLAKVKRRRIARDRLASDLRAVATEMVNRMTPLIDESRSLDAEIHGLFDALTRDRARSAAERDAVRRLYRGLQGRIISTRATERAGGAPSFESTEADEADLPPAASAARPADRDVLRALFRRLAEALHPDKVQDEVEKARRTELMKQITVAYQAGDFARLVELERAWATGEAIPAATEDEADQRVAATERANAELQTQLRAIEREIRGLRASPDGELAKEIKRRGGGDDELGGLTREAEEELTGLRRLRDFVQAFQNGEMSFAEFAEGPDPDDDEEDEEDLLDLAEAMAALTALMNQPPAAARRGRTPTGTKPRRR